MHVRVRGCSVFASEEAALDARGEEEEEEAGLMGTWIGEARRAFCAAEGVSKMASVVAVWVGVLLVFVVSYFFFFKSYYISIFYLSYST